MDFPLIIFFGLKSCQIIDLCKLREDVKKKVHAIIDKFAERGLRSLAVARQVTFSC